MSQPRIVNERRPRRSSSGPSPACTQPQGAPSGRWSEPPSVRRAVPCNVSDGVLALGNAGTHDRVVGLPVHGDLHERPGAAAFGVRHGQGHGVEPGLLEDVDGVGLVAGRAVAEIPSRLAAAGAAESHLQGRHALGDRGGESWPRAAASRRARTA